MLLLVLFFSITFLVLSANGARLLNFSPRVCKAFKLVGHFGLGFFAGFAIYAHGVDMLNGFLTGCSK